MMDNKKEIKLKLRKIIWKYNEDTKLLVIWNCIEGRQYSRNTALLDKTPRFYSLASKSLTKRNLKKNDCFQRLLLIHGTKLNEIFSLYSSLVGSMSTY